MLATTPVERGDHGLLMRPADSRGRGRPRPPGRRRHRPGGAAPPAQDGLDHPLHLLLGRPAVAGHRDLDLVGAVFVHRQAVLRGGQQHHSPRLAHGERGLDVLVEEQPLDAHRVRTVLLDELASRAAWMMSSRAAAPGRGRSGCSRGRGPERAALAQDDAVAGHRGPRVDAQDDHEAGRAPRPGGGSCRLMPWPRPGPRRRSRNWR